MLLRVTLVAEEGAAHDVVVRCDDSATWADLAGPLFAGPIPAGPRADARVDGVALRPGHRVGEPPLVEGAVVVLGRPARRAPRLPGAAVAFLELHVVGGPDAGQVRGLRPGRHRIGRAATADLVLADPDVSRLHAEVAVTPTGVTVADLGSVNGTTVDGARLEAAPVDLTEGARMLMGSSTLTLVVPRSRPAATRRRQGLVEVTRAAHPVPPTAAEELVLPAPPVRRATPRFPLVALLVPIAVAVPLALILRSPYFLAIGLMSPVMILGNLLSDRVTGRREYRERLAEHEVAVGRVRADVAVAVAGHERDRRTAHPDAAALLRIAEEPASRIWERRPGDAEWLAVVVGTGTVPSRVTVRDDGADRHDAVRTPPLHDVPVTVALAEVGVLGLAGARPRVLGLARSLVAQVATLHSPRDVRVVVLTQDLEAGRAWLWAVWLPHARAGAGLAAGAAAAFGVGPEQVRQRLAELGLLVDRRQAALATTGRAAGHPALTPTGDRTGDRTDVVVVVDGVQALREVPGAARLLAQGPAVGIHLVCLADDPSQLPVECDATVVVSGEVGARLRVRVSGQAVLDDVTADLVSARWAARLARGLAPLRDATPDAAHSDLPTQVRLLDLLEVDATDAAGVAAGWRNRPPGRGAEIGTPVGRSATGPLVLDLRRDGPHVLVAGTTGAGKSELLQTLIAGLCVANRPDEVAFVLVDYKGGSAFSDCADLPHVVGLVTDLDGALTARALESLGAEIRRREALLAAAGCATVEEYQAVGRSPSRGPAPPRMPGSAPGRPTLARLVLVVDEFRVLAEELPDFMAGLVRIAAVGRSLGVHLVLATQRPGGVVSADIRANVNLRISLRVQDVADSLDVVDSPHAARIAGTTPGRAVVRCGAQPLVAVQVARVAGTAPTRAVVRTAVRRLDVETLGDPLWPATAEADREQTPRPTDLRRIVDAVRAAAAGAGIPGTPSPWLLPLPTRLTLDRAAALAPPAPRAAGGLALTYALLDDPAGQTYRLAQWDLTAHGPLAVSGTARSGRSTAIRALLASMARQVLPQEAWAYVLDGAGDLADVAGLPHVGAVVDPADRDRSARLVRHLTAELGRRQASLAAAGASDLAEYRRAGDRPDPLPWVVLAVDGWEAVQQSWDDAEGMRRLDALQQLLRDGPRVGVLTVVTGGRSVLTGRIAAAVGHRLVLRPADPTDVVLAGVPARAAPSPWPPGRGLLVGGTAGDTVRQVQVTLLDDDPAGAAQRLALQRLAADPAKSAPGAPGRPPVVPAMPRSVLLSSLIQSSLIQSSLTQSSLTQGHSPPGEPDGSRWWLLGVGGHDVTAVVLDPAVDGPVQLVAGHPGSGRSTTLLTAAHGALLRSGRPVVVVAARPSPLRDLAGHPGVLAVLGADDAAPLQAALARARDGGRPAVVLLDDVDQLEGRPVDAVLQRLLAALAPGAEAVVAAGATSELAHRFSGLVQQLRRPGAGVVLGPSGPMDGDVLSVRLPVGPQMPGRGYVVRRGGVLAVQVARVGACLAETARPHRQATSPHPWESR